MITKWGERLSLPHIKLSIMSKIINGIIVQQFIKGWWGENKDGKMLLQHLDLPTNTMPFDAEELLRTNRIAIYLVNDIAVEITINKQDAYYEFTCKYPDKRFRFKLFREWDGTDIDTIIKMESYAVGECVRKVLTSRSVL